MLKDVLSNWAPKLAQCPIYIVGESYSGKIGPEFVLELVKVRAWPKLISQYEIITI
jgi:carboxypeptidase C (cathepsin A)